MFSDCSTPKVPAHRDHAGGQVEWKEPISSETAAAYSTRRNRQPHAREPLYEPFPQVLADHVRTVIVPPPERLRYVRLRAFHYAVFRFYADVDLITEDSDVCFGLVNHGHRRR